jgi:hypothetical protein
MEKRDVGTELDKRSWPIFMERKCRRNGMKGSA